MDVAMEKFDPLKKAERAQAREGKKQTRKKKQVVPGDTAQAATTV
jgi:hypothetical protein